MNVKTGSSDYTRNTCEIFYYLLKISKFVVEVVIFSLNQELPL